MRRSMHRLLLVHGRSERPGIEHMQRDHPLLTITPRVAKFGPIAYHKIRWDIGTEFLLVVLWAITKPGHLVEHLDLFPKTSGDIAVNNIFTVIVVLRQVCVVAFATARGHRYVPSVIIVWEVGVLTVNVGDGQATRVR